MPLKFKSLSQSSEPRVEVSIREECPYGEPAPISPWAHERAFDYIHRCVAGVYPEAGFAPYVQNSSTDSLQFCAICKRVYRVIGQSVTELDEEASAQMAMDF